MAMKKSPKRTEKEDLKFVIVGHVDHGKSTLIGRLLYDTGSIPKEKIKEIKGICDTLGKPMEFGFILDNLEEERDQGITIDTTQTFFDTTKRHYTIIDAPGHVEFVKNMITGASQAEAAILIVDAEEGVQEQTRRHAYILRMLGLKQVIAVLNKMDAVGYDKRRFAEVKAELTAFLTEISITPSFIIPISAKEGDNIAKKSKRMPWYDGSTVLKALDSFTPRATEKDRPLRFAVQDVYKNEKRIVVGRVESGTLHAGEKVTVLPSGEATEVTSIEEFLKESVKSAEAGKATGLVMKDKVFVDRGDIIVKQGEEPTVTTTVHCHLFWMDKEALKKGQRLTFECATQSVICEVKSFERIIDSSTLEEISRKELRNREVADVILTTSKPVVIDTFDNSSALGKFVLERKHTVAGGIITEHGLQTGEDKQ